MYDASSGGDHQIGTDGREPWIAASKGRLLFAQKAVNGPRGDYPDGGLSLKMHSNSGLGYTEIETLSAEKILKPGQRIENMLIMECIPFPTGLKAKDSAELASHYETALNGSSPPSVLRP